MKSQSWDRLYQILSRHSSNWEAVVKKMGLEKHFLNLGEDPRFCQLSCRKRMVMRGRPKLKGHGRGQPLEHPRRILGELLTGGHSLLEAGGRREDDPCSSTSLSMDEDVQSNGDKSRARSSCLLHGLWEHERYQDPPTRREEELHQMCNIGVCPSTSKGTVPSSSEPVRVNTHGQLGQQLRFMIRGGKLRIVA